MINAIHATDQLGRIGINDVFLDASNAGNLKAMSIISKLGVTDFNTPLLSAAMRDQFDVVRLLASLGATDYDRAISGAENHHRHEMIAVLGRYRAGLMLSLYIPLKRNPIKKNVQLYTERFSSFKFDNR